MVKRKYPQLVFSQMTRFKDSNGGYYLDQNNECFLVRNNTKIIFGNSQHLIGTVIMTNPGSYGLDEIQGWNNFKIGNGIDTVLEGYGHADMTMQNLIWVIKEAFNKANKVFDGYLNIYNISSVVCPQGENVNEYHNKVRNIIIANKMHYDLIETPIVNDQQKFIQICKSSPFLIMGFVKGVFNSKVQNLLQWAKIYNNIILSPDNSIWPSHPRRWRTEKNLRDQAISKILRVIE